jgi:uncharacterized membrane protein YgdD (TMEM256/DUF423 family)
VGAFGAHGAAKVLDARSIELLKTGAQYQMYHALALVGVAAWGVRMAKFPQFPAWAFVVGTLLFSGSLYALAASGARAFGAITPVGGLLFLAGWLALAWAAFSGSTA